MPSSREERQQIRARAVAMVEEERDLLAGMLVRQLEITVPRFQMRMADRRVENTYRVIDSARAFMVERDSTKLAQAIMFAWADSQLLGISPGEFMVASSCYLPVLRRFFVHRAESIEEGLRLFESMEAVILPFLSQVTTILINSLAVAAPPPSPTLVENLGAELERLRLDLHDRDHDELTTEVDGDDSEASTRIMRRRR